MCEESRKQINNHYNAGNKEIQEKYKIDLKNKYKKLNSIKPNIKEDYKCIILFGGFMKLIDTGLAFLPLKFYLKVSFFNITPSAASE